ncbi:DUF3429 domain-containing protein [Methyloradius palustris]|uniref:DUF3429 domain-containing protein n=1 Tax=Methyloradius palustris TaxID=2778876 RepID=A0A8D5G446_9PROT|nr:DUF3429 domain-containing protein [Methyloradius palustris]BCM25410.1 hypothetical protein ZMTM_16690 [Methyloradius palustris]
MSPLYKSLVLIPAWPRYLGLAGVIPFLLFGVLPWFQNYHAIISLYALLAYGAVILSFIGALHWAFAMMASTISESRRNSMYLWSVIPALIGWISLLLPLRIGLLISLLGFALHCVMDVKLVRAIQLPAWYLPLRFMLTMLASLGILSGQIYALTM